MYKGKNVRKEELSKHVILSVIHSLLSKEVLSARENVINIHNNDLANVTMVFGFLRMIATRHKKVEAILITPKPRATGSLRGCCNFLVGICSEVSVSHTV